MSDAREIDFQQFLDGHRPGIEDELRRTREQVLTTAASRGTLNSGGTLKHGVAAMEQVLSDYLAATMALADRWAGPSLPIARAREMIVAHLSSIVAELATTETAYRVGTRRPSDSALKAMEGLVSQARQRLEAKLREFELGADTNRNARVASVTNIVHATNIIGGVQQAGGSAIQANTVSLSAEAIAASLDHLFAHLTDAPHELLAELEPEAATIRSQLVKPTPNATIVQEAGRTIRTVLEGAIGGALGNAMSPGIVHALAGFSAAIGLG